MSSHISQVPNLPLRGDIDIPQLGFGVFQVPPEDTAEVTARALDAGYRHIDTAAAYRNEAGVGEALRSAGLDRGDGFITAKCFNDDHGYDEATREHEELGIVTEAWSPLAQGQVLDDPAVTQIAEAHGKSAGQVVIRWHLQLGNVVIPKSVTPDRIEQNFDVFEL